MLAPARCWWGVGGQVGAQELEKVTSLQAWGHPSATHPLCPFPETPLLAPGAGSPSEQMPASVGVGGLRKRLFIWGTRPICLVGEGPVASILGPDS